MTTIKEEEQFGKEIIENYFPKTRNIYISSMINYIFNILIETATTPEDLIKGMKDEDVKILNDFLLLFYISGAKTKNYGRDILQGFIEGEFSGRGEGVFALVAFFEGTKKRHKSKNDDLILKIFRCFQ